jgi:hypothetical protein
MQILHNHDLFCSRTGSIEMALDVLPEPQGRVLFEVRAKSTLVRR